MKTVRTNEQFCRPIFAITASKLFQKSRKEIFVNSAQNKLNMLQKKPSVWEFEYSCYSFEIYIEIIIMLGKNSFQILNWRFNISSIFFGNKIFLMFKFDIQNHWVVISSSV